MAGARIRVEVGVPMRKNKTEAANQGTSILQLTLAV